MTVSDPSTSELTTIVEQSQALTIIAGVKAANGEHWRYPLTIRFIK